jgi:hypothetical protein
MVMDSIRHETFFPPDNVWPTTRVDLIWYDETTWTVIHELWLLEQDLKENALKFAQPKQRPLTTVSLPGSNHFVSLLGA